MRHAIAYIENMEDLIDRDRQIMERAFAEPLFEALEAIFDGFS